MADIMPKMRSFLFLSFISLLFNLIAFVMSFAINGSATLGSFIGQAVTSFLPFVDIVSLAFLGFPWEIMALFGILTGIISAVKLWLLIEVVASHVPTVNV